MKTKLAILLLKTLLIFNVSLNLCAQVTVGAGVEPINVSALEIISQQESGPRGLRLPQLTATEVDILASNINQLESADKSRANGLMIFNTTIACVMVWNGKEFKSLCGDISPAEITFDCANMRIYPNNGLPPYTPTGYQQGLSLDGASSYITIPATVTKAGTYSVTATTGNGYSFITEGKMLDVGSYILKLSGMGTPITGNDNPQYYDQITLSSNGEKLTTGCTPTDLQTIPVAPAVGKATFTFNCGSSVVNGIYTINADLNSTNTITVQVNVSSPGYYSFSAEAAGMHFSRSGEWTTGGLQSVTLLSTGKPTQAGIVPITIIGESSGGNVTCDKNITVSYRAIKIAGFGGGTYQPGTASTVQSSRAIIQSSANFGATGTVPTQGLTIIDGGYNRISTVMSQNPDIIVIGYNYHTTAADNTVLEDFVNNKKGFVLAMTQDNGSADAALINAICGSSIGLTYGGGGGVVYQMPNLDNPILNGPFGDIRNLYWGEDAGTTFRANAIPAGATSLSAGNEIIWYNNFLWIGDGGFTSGDRTNSDPNIWPCMNDSQGRPISKSYRLGTVYNAQFYANVIAYAIKFVQANK
ncbi:hypothetical protein [Dysgonomonas sp.]